MADAVVLLVVAAALVAVLGTSEKLSDSIDIRVAEEVHFERETTAMVEKVVSVAVETMPYPPVLALPVSAAAVRSRRLPSWPRRS